MAQRLRFLPEAPEPDDESVFTLLETSESENESEIEIEDDLVETLPVAWVPPLPDSKSKPKVQLPPKRKTAGDVPNPAQEAKRFCKPPRPPAPIASVSTRRPAPSSLGFLKEKSDVIRVRHPRPRVGQRYKYVSSSNGTSDDSKTPIDPPVPIPETATATTVSETSTATTTTIPATTTSTTIDNGDIALSITHPELCKEWADTGSPNEFTAESRKNIKWLCPNCHHHWRAAIRARTYGINCPFCSGRKKRKPTQNDEIDEKHNFVDRYKQTFGISPEAFANLYGWIPRYIKGLYESHERKERMNGLGFEVPDPIKPLTKGEFRHGTEKSLLCLVIPVRFYNEATEEAFGVFKKCKKKFSNPFVPFSGFGYIETGSHPWVAEEYKIKNLSRPCVLVFKDGQYLGKCRHITEPKLLKLAKKVQPKEESRCNTQCVPAGELLF